MAYMLMSLRAVNHRLTNVPVQKLPQIAACLAASLTECGELLSAPQSQKTSKSDSDNAVQVHKLVTRLTSLLQDRTCEGRWTAVVLVKALVEAGQWEMLRGSEPFVRGLLSILNKSDPVSTKVLSVITLTRIFHLTYQYPTLVREITTPSLPAFITSTLNLISVKPTSEPTRRLKPNTPFLEVVLRAYAELIGRHPTIFRPFTAQIHSILQAIIGSTSSSFSRSVVEVGEQLFVALHTCAPKNTGAEEWKNACRMTIASIHVTSNHVFRAVVEQWESVDPSLWQQALRPEDYAQEVGNQGPDPLGLCGWDGLDSGINRVAVLLRMLSTFLVTTTASTVSVPVGSILDLTSRLMSVTVPSDSSTAQANPQISRTERENLFTELPRIHIACIKLLLALVEKLETGAVPVAQTILEQTLWVFRAERFSCEVRSSVYDLVNALLTHIGPSMNKKNVSSLNDIFRASCSDLLPPDGDNSTKEVRSDPKGKPKGNSAAVNADSFLNPNLKQGRQTQTSSNSPRPVRGASDLLSTVLTCVPTEFISPPLRAEIDRTIIMSSDKKVMIASVLNPFPAVRGRGANISIMPFLARSYAAEMEVEGLIRPRMPVLMNSTSIGQYNAADEDEEEDDIAPTSYTAPEATGLLKPSSAPDLHEDLMDVDVTQQSTTSPNKRNYAEESLTQRGALFSAATDAVERVLNKKVRVESATTSEPLFTSSTTTFSSTSTSSVPLATVPNTSMQPSSSVEKGVSLSRDSVSRSTPTIPERSASAAKPRSPSPQPSDDDSEGDLPTLNIDPDTDEEDDE